MGNIGHILVLILAVSSNVVWAKNRDQAPCGAGKCNEGAVCISEYANTDDGPPELIKYCRKREGGTPSCSDITCPPDYLCAEKEIPCREGDRPCKRVPTCLDLSDPSYDPCIATTCPRYFECFPVKVVCIRAPCPPVAQCFDTRITCANVKCPEGTKCEMREPSNYDDSDGCAKQPMCVPPRPASCDEVECEENKKCEILSTSCALGSICYPQPACVTEGDEKNCDNVHCMSSGYQCAKKDKNCNGASCELQCHPAKPDDGEDDDDGDDGDEGEDEE